MVRGMPENCVANKCERDQRNDVHIALQSADVCFFKELTHYELVNT